MKTPLARASAAVRLFQIEGYKQSGPLVPTYSSMQSAAPHDEVQKRALEKMPSAIQVLTRKDRPTVLGRNQITSFANATTFTYANEAGITAAAGTRLALQLALVM